MFLRDCPGHYQRCWGSEAYDQAAFEKGARAQIARPGDAVKPLHVANRGRPKKKSGRGPDDELDELDVAE
jgi:hypothetical protein